MKLTDVFAKNQFAMSMEVFPPKTSDRYESVSGVVREIAAIHPAFISVTYGAGGGTSDYTLALAKEIKNKHGVPSLAHLTCVSSTRETVKERILAIREAGIQNIMALRGDIPEDRLQEDRSQWDYTHAVELVREIRILAPEMCIGGACYPEVHPESTNMREDIQHLKEKVDAGCDFLTTQMFFDNNLFYSFLYKIREAGITVPIVPGIMPITSAKQVERALKLSGSFMPQRFKSLVDRFGDSDEAMCQAGIAYATDQIIDLYANGIPLVHVYSMNKPDVAAGIMANVSAILGKNV